MSAPEPKEIREAYQDYRSDWSDTRDQGDADMQAISPEGPWSDEDRAKRENAGRPCIHLDQINQFLNRYSGDLRKNKRAIRAIPKGNGANDQDAGRRSSLIKGIEERSNAPSAVYIPAAEGAAQRSYAFARIVTEYRDGATFDQEILLKPVPNPDCALINPNYKQFDASDIEDAFLLEQIPKKSFKAKYPNAEITDFSGQIMEQLGVGDWVRDKEIQIAEYWRVERDRRKLLMVKTARGPIVLWEDEYKKSKDLIRGEVQRDRMVETPRVVQYLTNGLEILDEVPWHGSRIPIIACLGPERWTTKGGRAKRELLSMVRFARDPQMLFDFLATQECELAGMVPKVAYRGYVGQFETDKEAWETINSDPHPFVQTDVVIDAGTGQVLPLPQRENFDAPFQEYELAKDAASRAVLSSMGMTPLPAAAARRNEKSGVALDKIDDMESLGCFHFVDRFENGFIRNLGYQVNELITPILDTKREMPVAKPDGSRDVIHVVGNTSHPIGDDGSYDTSGLPEDHVHTGRGDFDVTISSGPSADSEREGQEEFVDQLIDNMPNLPAPGTPQAKVLALGIRMRPDLGPIGQQIAEVFDPPDPNNLPPQAQAIIAQLKGQMQQLQQENTALHMDRAGRVLEQQTKFKIEAMKLDGAAKLADQTKRWDYITRVVVAELAKGSKAEAIAAQLAANKELTLLGFDHDQIDRAHDSAHDLAKSQLDHNNAMELASHTAAITPQPGATDDQGAPAPQGAGGS
jgi:hypothetical protein